jgi:hypothetical protein
MTESQIESQVESQTEEQNFTQTEAQSQFIPVFQDIESMNAESALNVLIQAAAAAQNAGRLNIRDAVVLAKAIELVRPGSI